jgi:pyridoxal phosphate enzyme (YggS family)
VSESARRAELAANLAAVSQRIAHAARGARRDPDGVRLIVVTKTFPASDLRLLCDLGVRDVGENRHPEAGDKAAALSDLPLVWHFVGQIQSNKAAHIAAYADVVHSVDSAKLVRRLGTAAQAAGRVLTCLVQVSLDEPGAGEGRAGVAVAEIPAIADAIAAADGLALGGLMGVAPLGQPPEPAFDRLATAWVEMRRDHPEASMLSAGMSNDFEAAIRAGATHVRVGSAVMGARPRLG